MDRMTTAETETRSPRPTIRRPAVRRSPWPPWMEPILANWRRRWPAAFARPMPLAIGIREHIEAALEAEGNDLDRKSIGVTLQRWTTQGPYLRAVLRGERRRNLDGSEAGVPDDAACRYAQRRLDERAARRAQRERESRRGSAGAGWRLRAAGRNSHSSAAVLTRPKGCSAAAFFGTAIKPAEPSGRSRVLNRVVPGFWGYSRPISCGPRQVIVALGRYSRAMRYAGGSRPPAARPQLH